MQFMINITFTIATETFKRRRVTTETLLDYTKIGDARRDESLFILESETSKLPTRL
jgi:hypothetical protein